MPEISSRCINCGRIESAHHLNGQCPRGLVMTIDADSVDRVNVTHHPRTLWNVIQDNRRDVFTNVTIDRIHVVEPAAPEAIL